MTGPADIPPEANDPTLWAVARDFMRDPAAWGSATAVFLLRMPLLRGIAYFVAGVGAANFLEPLVAERIGKPGAAAVYLGACFGLAGIEKVLSMIGRVDTTDLWADIRQRIRGNRPPPKEG